MQDADLIFAQDQRPAVSIVGATPSLWMFDNGLVANKWLDLRQQSDLGRGQPLYAHFKVKTSFAGDALNVLRFCIAVDDATNFSGTVAVPAKILVRGPDLVTGSLLAGVLVTLVLPPLNTLVIPLATNQGARYLGLGMQVIVPTTDWTAGAVDAWLSPVHHRVRPSGYQSGY